MVEDKYPWAVHFNSALARPSERFNHRANRPINIEDVNEVIRSWDVSPTNVKVEWLTGGFSNSNFLVSYNGQKKVVRFYPDGIKVAERELAILELAKNHYIQVPHTSPIIYQNDKKVSLTMDFIEGKSLARLLDENSAVSPSVFYNVGIELAKIHKITFANAGWIGAGGLVTPFGTNFSIVENFILPALAGRAGQRLGKQATQELKIFIEKYWPLVEARKSQPVLAHCDFNPKNILVNSADEVCIIDWEFSISADGLIDVGNFLRFDEDYTQDQRDAFLAGLQAQGEKLPDNWRLLSQLHDLVSMCSFLDREEEYPKTIKTACYVIAKTLRG